MKELHQQSDKFMKELHREQSDKFEYYQTLKENKLIILVKNERLAMKYYDPVPSFEHVRK